MTQHARSRIARELYIDASPEVVFRVVSTPEHILEWWPDSGEISPVPGDPGWIGFGDITDGGKVVQITVADAVPYRHFSFRWTHAEGEVAGPGNSNLVSFDLEPVGGGTRLRFTEVGFDERGLSETEAAEMHGDHSSGWDYYLPKLVAYAEKTAA